MRKITRKEFGRLTAHAVFFQSALIMVEILFLLGLLIFLQIKRYDETIALFVAIAILLAAWVFHFAALNKYVKHIRATAELSRLAEEKDIAIVPVKQIRQKRILQKSASQPHLHAVWAPPCRSFSPTFTL